MGDGQCKKARPFKRLGLPDQYELHFTTSHGWRAVLLLKGVPKMSRNRNEINPFDEWFPASAVTASTTEPESEADPIEAVEPEWLDTEFGGYWILPGAGVPPDHTAFLEEARAEFEAAGSPAEWTDEAGKRHGIELDPDLGELHVVFQTPRPANDDDPAGSAALPVEGQAMPGEAAPATGPPGIAADPSARLELALSMAARGFRVFPLLPGSKEPPKGVAGVTRATTDAATIRAWFAADPAINYGVAAGSGLLVVDVDGEQGEASLAKLEAEHGTLPATLTVGSPSNGRHLYMRGDDVSNSAGKIGPGIDIRSAGGYVVGPGSYFANAERRPDKRAGWYAIANDVAPAAAPPWLMLMAGEAKQRERDQAPVAKQDAPEDIARARHYLEKDALPAIEGQGGDAQTYKAACELRDLGLSEATALDLMRTLYNPRCLPPWDGAGLAVKVANAFAYGQNSPAVKSTEAMRDAAGPFTPLPASEAAKAPAKRFRATVFDPTAPIDPPEHYLYGLHHVKGILTVTAAPGGYGKSQLGLGEAMCMAAGRELLGERVYEPLRVWFVSLDDPVRITRKRAMAFMKLHGLSASDFGNGRLMLDGSDTLPPSLVKVATGGRDGVKVDDATVSAFMAELKERQVDVLILDPLVKFHAVEENDNPAMNIVGETLAGIAARAGCAVETIVHTSKPKGQQITAEHVRGASSFVNAARAVRVVNPMTEDEARRLGIAEEKRLRLFRVDLSKGNLAPPSDARWFQRMPVALDNGNDRMPEGESFPAVTRYRLPDPIATTTDLDIAKALKKLAAGPDGAGSPWRASDKASGYIGVGIAEALGLDTGDPQTRATCRRLIKDWLARGLLIERRTRVKSEGRDTPFIHIPADWRERLAALAASARACAVTADEAGPGIEDPNRRT
jgi:hypothetical protein